MHGMNTRNFISILLTLVLTSGAVLAANPAQNNATSDTSAASSAPENHLEAYKEFKAALDKQTKDNSMDCCPAIMIALNATDDELCIDRWMEKAAEEGNAAALNFVGTKYLIRVMPEDRQTRRTRDSVALVKKAADKKYAPAMIDYSAYLRAGIGTLANTAAATRILLEACRDGNIETRYHWLLKSDRLKSYDDIKRGEVQSEIKRGNHHVIYHLGMLAPNNYLMYTNLTKAARMGNPNAMYVLSEQFSRVNHQVSYHYLKAAAAHHHPTALATLGHYLLDPNKRVQETLGVHANPAAGLLFLKAAAILGNETARIHLAHFYYHGLHGISKNMQKAYRHIEEGAIARPDDVGFMTAQAYMLLSGTGVKADPEKGKALLNKAADVGYPYAKTMRAYVNYRGIGTEPKPKDAIFELEELAAAHGFDICFVYLALMFDEGAGGLEKDEKKVQYYLEHAKTRLGEQAIEKFNYHKETYGQWTLPPFNL